MTTYNKEWRKRNPEKVRAHTAINNAIRYGKIKRKPCEECGKEKSHAHHEDYSKVLDVKWLCSQCHKDAHFPQKKKGKVIYDKKPPRLSWHKHGRKPLKRHILIDKAVELKKTMSYSCVAKELNISKGTVYKWLNNPKYY